jgi:hypothetical protein
LRTTCSGECLFLVVIPVEPSCPSDGRQDSHSTRIDQPGSGHTHQQRLPAGGRADRDRAGAGHRRTHQRRRTGRRDINTDYHRAAALTGIAQALAGAGHTSDAERVAGAAERLAATINDDDQRARALAGVARALATAGQTSEAERIGYDLLFASDWSVGVLVLAELTATSLDAAFQDWTRQFSGDYLHLTGFTDDKRHIRHADEQFRFRVDPGQTGTP